MKTRPLSWGIICVLIFVLVTASFGCTPSEEVEEYPSKTINIILPWNAGGRTDIFVRALAHSLEKDLGVPVVVSNHVGGVGVIGARAVAAAGKDGYTVGPFTVAHLMSRFIRETKFEHELYDPVAGFVKVPHVIVVSSESPWDTVEDFFDYAKENPGAIRHGNSGAGTEDHLAAAKIYGDRDISVVQVPYQGDAPLIPALLSGEVDVTLIGTTAIAPHYLSGDFKILTISTDERFSLCPDVPTMKELGIDPPQQSWTGLFVPKGTPENVIKRLRDAVEVAIEDPDFVDVMESIYTPICFYDTDELGNQVDETNQYLESTINELEKKGIKLLEE